ncbi:MAG TPA: amidase, partial [Thermomicrobiaceae bacterium]|nr:amidase [Thermomicrobiaceae bacterium]
MSELYELTAAEIVRQATSRELSARAVVDALLERISEFDGELRAWVTVDAKGAREQADRLDQAAADGRFGPLQGVPVGVKDIIDVAGLPTIAGFEPFRGRAIDRDATIVSRLRKAGAIILGKTHTTQFANGDPAPTVNPWNREKTPGGSSSGSGAAVAARMVPLALGTQTVGSTLRPAAYCGVAAFKPSFNWIDRDGVVPLAWSLDHLGLIARTVEDLALVYGVLTSGRPLAIRPGEPPRLAYLKSLAETSEPPVSSHLDDVAERLRAAGAMVEEVELPVEFELIQATHFVIMQSEVSAIHAELRREHPEEYGPSISRSVDVGSLIPAPFDIKARRLR